MKIENGVQVWDSIEEIPYDQLRPGGTFYVKSVPAEMNAPGLGMVGVPTGSNDSGGPTPSLWVGIFAALVAYQAVIIYTTCVCVVVAVVGYTYYKITVRPEGKIIQKNSDGSSVYQASNGGLYSLNADGTSTEITPPPADSSDLIKYAVIGVIVIVALIILAGYGPRLMEKVKGAAASVAPDKGK